VTDQHHAPARRPIQVGGHFRAVERASRIHVPHLPCDFQQRVPFPSPASPPPKMPMSPMSPVGGSRKTMSPASKTLRGKDLSCLGGHGGHKCPKLPIGGISLYRTCFCNPPLCPPCPPLPNLPLLPIPLGSHSTDRTQFCWCCFAGDRSAFLRVSGCRVPHDPREGARGCHGAFLRVGASESTKGGSGQAAGRRQVGRWASRTGPGCAGRPGNARGSAVEHAHG
jgi:hypothetical protein